MKKIFKKFIAKLREKLELDNPEKYINGYYQLSGKQKKLWVLGLFLVALGFSVVKVCVFGKKDYLFDVVLIGSILSSISMLLSSLFPAYIFFASATLFKNGFFPKKKIRKIALYQLWTIFLAALIFSVVFQIKLPFPFLH